MKWLIKVTKDESGTSVTRTIKYRTDSKAKPRGHELVEGPKTEYPKIEIDSKGVVSVIEDSAIKDSQEPMKERRKRYAPTGDQLDSIYKGFKHLDGQGIDIGVDAKKWVDEITTIKEDHPKR